MTVASRPPDQPPMVEPGFRLDYFSKNKIERAVDQTARTRLGVKLEIEAHGEKFRVLVYPAPDAAKRLEERSRKS